MSLFSSSVAVLAICVLSLMLSACQQCRADWDLVTFSDSDCTVPSSIIPTVHIPEVAFDYDNSTCVPETSAQYSLVPTGGGVRWLAYYCGASAEDYGYIQTFTYNAAGGGCPWNNWNYLIANTTLQTFQLSVDSVGCRYMNYAIYNVSTGKQDTGELFGNWSCTNTSSAGTNGAASSTPSLLNHLITATVTVLAVLGVASLSAPYGV